MFFRVFRVQRIEIKGVASKFKFHHAAKKLHDATSGLHHAIKKLHGANEIWR
jgi:hypothetical protein